MAVNRTASSSSSWIFLRVHGMKTHLKIDGQGPMHIECPLHSTLCHPAHSISIWGECKKMQPSVKSNKTSNRNGNEWEEGSESRVCLGVWLWARSQEEPPTTTEPSFYGGGSTHRVDSPDPPLATDDVQVSIGFTYRPLCRLHTVPTIANVCVCGPFWILYSIYLCTNTNVSTYMLAHQCKCRLGVALLSRNSFQSSQLV